MQHTSETFGADITTIIANVEHKSPAERDAMLQEMTIAQLRAILAYGMVDLFAGDTETDSCSSETTERIRAVLRRKTANLRHCPM